MSPALNMCIAKAASKAIMPAQALPQILGETGKMECILKLIYNVFDAWRVYFWIL
jgi:hypothetical protein